MAARLTVRAAGIGKIPSFWKTSGLLEKRFTGLSLSPLAAVNRAILTLLFVLVAILHPSTVTATDPIGKLAEPTIPGLAQVDETEGSIGPNFKSRIGAEIIPGITRAQESALLPLLTTVEQVRRLSIEQAAQGYVVKIQGVVTLNAPGTAQTFIQDATGGLYIGQAAGATLQKDLRQGQLVEVRGKTVRGRFSRHVNIDPNYAGAIQVLGEAPLPEPIQLNGESLSEQKNDAQWSEITGVVRRIKRRLVSGNPWAAITLSSGNTRFEAMCVWPSESSNFEEYLGAEVRLRGVPSPIVSERGQLAGRFLIVESPKDITVLRPPNQNPSAEPVRAINTLAHLEIGQTSSPRVHVRGAVTFTMPDRGFYLTDGSAAIRVESPERIPAIGTEVDVLGFAEWSDWSPILEDTTITPTGHDLWYPPKVLAPGELSSGNFDGVYIQTEAILLHIARPASGPLLVLQGEGRIFEARFATPSSVHDLQRLPEQSRIRMTGILVYQKPPDWVDRSGIASKADPAQAVPFELLLASPDNIQIISKPSWWNKTRITIALSALGIVGLLALAWILTLRSQVELLTEITSAQKVREATSEERTRVARELHDSVEQELAGLTIQLDAVKARLASAPESAASAVETARAMLRHTREEARRSIWDLRSMVLERGDLASALTEVASDPGGNGEAQIRVETSGQAVRLSSKTELNLVRICQEATSNARKYAEAREILVELKYAPEMLTLSISDDGCGFDASNVNSVRLGHFGLLHMRERAEQIGADFTIKSSPGKGTVITAHIPIPKDSGQGS